ncbi:MAG: hypothetical protein ACI8RD_008725 [Bacillariaceae sp.]|jgi:hypothetical protein
MGRESTKSDNNNRSQQQQRGKSPRRTKPKGTKSGDKDSDRRTKSGDSDVSSSSRGGGGGGGGRKKSDDISLRSERSSLKNSNSDYNVLVSIPKEYLSKPDKAEPILYYLPKTAAKNNSNGNDGHNTSGSGNNMTKNKFPNLRVLLAAAQDDIRLHRARQQAAKYRDPKLLSTYKIESDEIWLTCQQRLHERELLLGKIDMDRNIIIKELLEGKTTGMTANEATAIQLARWQRALELYVYDPPRTQLEKQQPSSMATTATPSGEPQQYKEQKSNLDFLQLLEKLREIVIEVSLLVHFVNLFDLFFKTDFVVNYCIR